jgi:hypothetical protein
MDSLPFLRPREVLPQRGHGLRPRSRRPLTRGSKMTITAPSRGPPKTACLRGKSRGCPGSAPFGGRNGLVWVRLRSRLSRAGGGGHAPLWQYLWRGWKRQWSALLPPKSADPGPPRLFPCKSADFRGAPEGPMIAIVDLSGTQIHLHAARAYSWISPPSRSRRWIRVGWWDPTRCRRRLGIGGVSLSARCGLCVL